MNKIKIIAVFIICLLFSAIANAQAGSCTDCRSFRSAKMYLEKSNNRIISIEASLFEFNTNGQIQWMSDINIRSYDKKFNYFQLRGSNGYTIDTPDSIKLTADSAVINSQSIFYSSLRERIVNSEKKGFTGFKPTLKDGKVFDEKGIEVTGVLAESITLKYSLDEFRKLEKTQKITLEINKETYKLSKDQIKEIASIAKKTDSK